MGDLIDRQKAIDALKRAEALTRAFGYHNVIETIRELPSAQPDKDLIHLQKEQAYMQGYEDGQKSRKGKWIRWHETLEDASGVEYMPRCKCSECGKEYEAHSTRFINFCPNCGSYNGDSNNTKPKSCFECEYSVDYDDDTAMCSEIKNMVSTSRNHDMIPPFCPKYVRADMRERKEDGRKKI